MGKVLFGLSVSLDGFIADKHGDVSQVFAWMGKAMEQLHEVGGDTFQETGAVIMGHSPGHGSRIDTVGDQLYLHQRAL